MASSSITIPGRSRYTLYAAGLNAQGHLFGKYDPLDTAEYAFSHNEFAFYRVNVFRELGCDQEDVTVIYTCQDSTVFYGESDRMVFMDADGVKTLDLEPGLPGTLQDFFGDETGMHGCIDDQGVLYTLEPGPELVRHPRQPGHVRIHHIGEAGNGKICITSMMLRLPLVMQFESFETFLAWYDNPAGYDSQSAFLIPSEPGEVIYNNRVLQLVANAGVFLCLLSNGLVMSWGDANASAECLGRRIQVGSEDDSDNPEEAPDQSMEDDAEEDSEEESSEPEARELPADYPADVPRLEHVRRIESGRGGWLSAALDDDNCLYYWGVCMPGGEDDDRPFQPYQFNTGPDGLAHVAAETGARVHDFDLGVGDNHITLVERGEPTRAWGDNRNFYVIGDNRSSQLGTPNLSIELGGDYGPGNSLNPPHGHFCRNWYKPEFPLHIRRVWCGSQCTFVLASETWPTGNQWGRPRFSDTGRSR